MSTRGQFNKALHNLSHTIDRFDYVSGDNFEELIVNLSAACNVMQYFCAGYKYEQETSADFWSDAE